MKCGSVYITFPLLFLVFVQCWSQSFQEISTSVINLAGGEAVWGDYDNDGDLDILINGTDQSYNKIARIYQNSGGTFNYQSGILLTGVLGATADWVDYDNDGDLDIMMTGNEGSSSISKIWRNNGNNTFTEQQAISFPGISYGCVAWGDYNNDGDPDVLITGQDINYKPFSKLFRNNGNGSFTEQSGANLIAVYDGSADWGDYDKDGDLDILLSGNSGSSRVSKVYRNNADNSFTEQTNIVLPGVEGSSGTWVDYDNDGDLDILISGTTVSEMISKIYRNNNNSFTEQTGISLTGISSSSVSWGDYDNDGDPDLLMNGQDKNYSPVSKIYRNNGDNTFTDQTMITLTGLAGSAAWGDYDNDGDLDILLTGYNSTWKPVTLLYRNNGVTFNTKPTSPAGLSGTVTGNTANLTWNKSTDSQTPQAGLSYNIYVSTSPSGSNVKSPNAIISSGFRKVTETGEIRDNKYTIKNLNPGTYYWSVQSIDAALAGSVFASQENFTINFSNSISPVEDQYLAPGKTGNALTVSESLAPDSRQWKYSTIPGGPYNKVITGATSTTYTPQLTTDSIMYVVCVSTKSGISVTSNEVKIELFQFDEQTTISFPGISHGSLAWGDYDKDKDLDILICGINESSTRVSKVYRNNGNNSFTEQTGISITGVAYGSADWVDYDNDGNLDIMVTGQNQSSIPVSKIYKNNGNNSFTEQTGIVLRGLYYSSTDWGDYDNDGDPDLLLTGRDQSGSRITRIYKNNRNNSFSEQTGISISAVDMGDCSWADYDNDGDLDIVITGYNPSLGPISKIFRNNGNNTFTEQTSISLTGVYNSSVALADYNDDEYLDILLTGYNTASGQPISKIYRNNRDNSFSEQTGIQLTGIYLGSAEWGDFDNDGDLDILLSGLNSSGTAVSEIYRNSGSNSFSRLKSNSFYGVHYSNLIWGDYDNDRDLDILLSGYTGTSRMTKIYRNSGKVLNTPPDPPKDLDMTINGSNVTFTWYLSSDKETHRNGLSYNLRIGTSPGAGDVKSADASPASGYHYCPAHGNVGHTLTWTINNLTPGSYFWSVQAIDHGYLTSEFAPEQAFENYFTPSGYSYSNGSGVPYVGDYDRDGDLDILIGNSTTTTIYRNDISSGSGFTDIIANMPNTYSGDNAMAWGDYDNDGDLDIAFSGYYGQFFTRIFRNDNGVFTDINAGMQGIWMGTSAWGDYDNDGDLDLFIYGNHEYSDDGEPLGILYRNDGNDTFTDSGIKIEDARRGDVALSDYNKDGYLDIAICGYNLSTNLFTSILRNNKNNTFTNIDAGINGYSYGDLAWGDYDADGDPDLLITGRLTGDQSNTCIYQNQGNGTFADIGLVFPAEWSYSASAEWGDYDNDGDLDVLLSLARSILRNDGNNKFTQLDIGLELYSATWGDIDNDGDLDIISGSAIYLNNVKIKNSAPAVPKGLKSKVAGDQVTMSWDKSTDGNTPVNALTYNVCVGTRSGKWDILSPMTDKILGYKKLVSGMGNAGTNTFKIIGDLPPGTYYWTVQTVDNGYMSSAFSAVQSFEILPMFTQLLTNSNGIWGDYDNDGDLDFLESKFPKMSVFRNDGSDIFTEKVINISETNEEPAWCDYDNDGDLDIITCDSIFRNDQNNVFTRTGIYFPNRLYTKTTGDYDADGDPDILAKINDGTKEMAVVYRNDKNNIFTKIILSLVPDNWIENLSWFDYDNDSDLDIVLVYGPYLEKKSQIFRNDGNNNFTNIHADLIGLWYCDIAFADLDNDRDLDLILGGQDNIGNNHSRIYRNDGNDSFTDISSDIRGYYNPSIFCGDHNDDGYIDIIFSGYNNGRTRNKVYLNNQDGTFTEKGIENIIEYINILSFGDYDNDGDLDAITSDGIYRNNTNPSSGKPPVITGLSSDMKGLDCLLTWNRASDEKSAGYSYNLRIGTTSANSAVKSPKSPPGFGNVPADTSWLIRSLQPGLYYWTVQAVNQTYSGGTWAPVKSFLITNVSPDFSFDTVCYRMKTTFKDLSVTTDTIIKWKWNFGDGTLSYERNPVHQYQIADTFDVSLKVFSQAGDSAERIRKVIVKAAPDASFTVSPVCKDQPSVLVNHSDISQITVATWEWNFGNGEYSAVQNTVQKIYARSDTATLTIIAANGCWDSDTKTVTVAEYPNASIFLSPGYSNVFCSGDSTILIVNENPSYKYQWKLNNVNILGATKASLRVKGPTGAYSIAVENPVASCVSSSSIPVTVNTAPNPPTITYSGNPNALCEGDSFLLSVPDISGYRYDWKLNGGATGTNSSHHTAKNSGTYTIVVANSTGCSASSSNSVNVLFNSLPKVTAVSLSGPTDFCQGGNVTLSVPLTSGYKYNWRNEFGLITGAVTNNYTTGTAGTYLLEVSNQLGCMAQTSPVIVNVMQIPLKPVLKTLNYTPGECPGEDPVSLGPTQTSDEYLYQWYRDGLPILHETRPLLLLDVRGIYKLEVSNGGCKTESDTFEIDIPVPPSNPSIYVQGPNVWYLACSDTTSLTYKWFYNGNPIEGANKYYYVANRKLGEYQVRTEYRKGCFSRSNIVTIPTGTTGITEYDPFNGLIIYPNPGNGRIAIQMDNGIFGELTIRIIDQNGKEIRNLKFEKTQERFYHELDLNGQVEGLYLMLFYIDNHFTSRKMIIK